MRMRVWGLVIALLAAAIFSVQAFAKDEGCCKNMKMCSHEKMMGGMSGKMDLDEMFFYKAEMIKDNAAELGINDEQMEKVKMLKADVKKNTIKSDADVEIISIDVDEMLGKDEVDVAGVNALIDKKYNIKLMAAKSLVASYADLKKVLTKDQMKKLHEIWNKDMMAGKKCTMMDDKKDMMGSMRKDMKK